MAQVEPSAHYADAPVGVWPHVNKAVALLRVAVGLLFAAHGSQKLFGWFGGQGIDEFAASLTKLGLEPPITLAYLEASVEVLGGLALAAGLLTPLVAAALIGDMLVAALKVHAAKGFWSENGGYEYNLVLIVLLVGIGLIGAGRYSLDQWLGVRMPRPHVFVVAVAAALAVAAFVVL
jgi:putative oxidoreductase